MLKKSLKIFFGFLILLVIVIGYLLSDFNPVYKNEEFVSLISKLEDAKKENLTSFVEIQTKIYKKTDDPKCPCHVASNSIGPYRHGYSITKLFYELKIEKEYTKIECFKFFLLNADFMHKNIGVKAASKFYFNKNINELNEKEILTLIAMLKNPSLYTPARNKQGLQNRVQVLERIVHMQNN